MCVDWCIKKFYCLPGCNKFNTLVKLTTAESTSSYCIALIANLQSLEASSKSILTEAPPELSSDGTETGGFDA